MAAAKIQRMQRGKAARDAVTRLKREAIVERNCLLEHHQGAVGRSKLANTYQKVSFGVEGDPRRDLSRTLPSSALCARGLRFVF